MRTARSAVTRHRSRRAGRLHPLCRPTAAKTTRRRTPSATPAARIRSRRGEPGSVDARSPKESSIRRANGRAAGPSRGRDRPNDSVASDSRAWLRIVHRSRAPRIEGPFRWLFLPGVGRATLGQHRAHLGARSLSALLAFSNGLLRKRVERGNSRESACSDPDRDHEQGEALHDDLHRLRDDERHARVYQPSS